MSAPPQGVSEETVPNKTASVGAIVTAFLANDPEDPNDRYDVLTGWINAVDELALIGAQEVSFGVYRQVKEGRLTGGPSIRTVNLAVQHAKSKGLSVTLLPVFETEGGWRGIYDPAGRERTVFQRSYLRWVFRLARIQGVDRLNIGSELNRMVANSENETFFAHLLKAAQKGFQIAGNQEGRIGYAANFDVFNNEPHRALFAMPGMGFIGISAYRPLIDAGHAGMVSGTDKVSDELLAKFVESWTHFLDAVEDSSAEFNLPIVIQEVGAVQQNYATAAPFAVQPGNFVAEDLPSRFAFDPHEQAAVFESLFIAMQGRGDKFESVTFWTWEHQASRGRRTTDVLGTQDGFESFAVYPGDGGGGDVVTRYLAVQAALKLAADQQEPIVDQPSPSPEPVIVGANTAIAP